MATDPIVTQIAFSAFSYHEFDDGAHMWLRADVSIKSGSPEDREAVAVATVAIVAYPCGLLVLFGGLLFRARRAITSGQESVLGTAIRFLHREYKVCTPTSYPVFYLCP